VKLYSVFVLFAVAISLVACESAPPARSPAVSPTTPPAPIVVTKPEIVEPTPSSLEPAKPTARLAALNPQLEAWKQRAAGRIHEVNSKQLFEGRPEHLLRAVIVVEATVDRNGKVTNSKIMRSPGIASLDAAALKSLGSASPLPSPPASLIARGPLVYQETWLFRKDGRFQLRSLALPQE